jgi:hypothetical protein
MIGDEGEVIGLGVATREEVMHRRYRSSSVAISLQRRWPKEGKSMT